MSFNVVNVKFGVHLKGQINLIKNVYIIVFSRTVKSALKCKMKQRHDINEEPHKVAHIYNYYPTSIEKHFCFV